MDKHTSVHIILKTFAAMNFFTTHYLTTNLFLKIYFLLITILCMCLSFYEFMGTIFMQEVEEPEVDVRYPRAGILCVFVRCMLGNESGSSAKAPSAQIHELALQPQLSLIKKNPSSSTFEIQLLSSIISKYTQIFFKIFWWIPLLFHLFTQKYNSSYLRLHFNVHLSLS